MTKTEKDEYYRRELATAFRQRQDGSVAPPKLPVSCRVLDVGCGAGETLIASYGDRLAFGVDIDPEAVSMGRSLTNRVAFVCAAAEDLPFASNSFDSVISRVSLYLTPMSRSVREVHRVLRPAGTVWILLYRWQLPRRQERYNILRWAYFAYLAANGILFHLFLRQFKLPGRRSHASFQTASAMARLLARVGFTDISISDCGILTATRST